MLVLGLQGSPRKKGNTDILLAELMDEVKGAGNGVQALTIDVPKKNIKACRGCRVCEKTGHCSIKDDDMTSEIYPLLWKADLIVMASPIFFYSAPSQIKALIDRTQTMWARKYMLNIEDPGRKWRQGFMIAIGATKGKNLFEGLSLTAKYFFDAPGANYTGYLGYRHVEKKGEINEHPEKIAEVRQKAKDLLEPLQKRKKALFVCRENACRSQMSAAFARLHGGDKLEVASAGDSPADEVNPVMKEVMAEKGIDMEFIKPQTIIDATAGGPSASDGPDYAFTMGCEVSCPVFPGSKRIEWELPDPAGKPIEFMRELRDDIESRILEFVKGI